MNDLEFERMLERLVKQDFSAGTEAFRDALLERCLSVLDAESDGTVIPDADLDLLAAAGDDSMWNRAKLGNGLTGSMPQKWF